MMVFQVLGVGSRGGAAEQKSSLAPLPRAAYVYSVFNDFRAAAGLFVFSAPRGGVGIQWFYSSHSTGHAFPLFGDAPI